MHVVPHRVQGRFYGAWYYLDNGSALYLAHRKRREVYNKRVAWCIDLRTLEEARTRGIKVIGVVTRSGKDKFFYLTLLDDFFDSPYSFAHFGDTRQRGLPLNRFRVNPGTSAKYIASAVKIR